MTTISDLIAGEKYAANKVFNLDPENVLSMEERNALRLRVGPAIAQVRAELSKHMERVLEVFRMTRESFKLRFPASELYFDNCCQEFESEVEEVLIQTMDLEDLIDSGAPQVFVTSHLQCIRDNLRYIRGRVETELKRLKWHNLGELAKSTRSIRGWKPLREKSEEA